MTVIVAPYLQILVLFNWK